MPWSDTVGAFGDKPSTKAGGQTTAGSRGRRRRWWRRGLCRGSAAAERLPQGHDRQHNRAQPPERRVRADVYTFTFIHTYVCICIYCMCVCVCVYIYMYIHTHTHTPHKGTCGVCVCVCVCVCVLACVRVCTRRGVDKIAVTRLRAQFICRTVRCTIRYVKE
jgi:hypothetical protein